MLALIAAPARSPAQPPDSMPVTISGGWAGERAGAASNNGKVA